jgi:hypothetical protein
MSPGTRLAAGTYQATATVQDAVGNQTTVTDQVDGTPVVRPDPIANADGDPGGNVEPGGPQLHREASVAEGRTGSPEARCDVAIDASDAALQVAISDPDRDPSLYTS